MSKTCSHLRTIRDVTPSATRHPVVEGYDPPEGWGWRYVDEVAFDLSDPMTLHNGPIP